MSAHHLQPMMVKQHAFPSKYGMAQFHYQYPYQHTRPISMQVLARRCSYLPLLLIQVKSYLCDKLKLSIKVDDAEIWFSANGIPLKWHYPIGLLFDIYSLSTQKSKPIQLPWNIAMHYTDFPSDSLITMDEEGCGPNTLRDHFMGMIKQADYMRNGSISRVMTLSTQDQTQLWDSIGVGHHDLFWQVNSGLVSDTLPKHIPVRIYMLSNAISGIRAFTVLQDLYSPYLPDGQTEMTAGDMGLMGTLILHGVVVPPDMGLLWLSRHASYSDGFLHFVFYTD
ncbi:autophagy protein 5, variant 2 [Batrachochytrium dendrobatidis]